MIQLFKLKSLKKTRESLTSNVEEKTREKAILKEGIGTNREAFVSRRGRTRASLFGTYTPSKMGFAVRGSKKQRGRSMVEMLGVLAIIGVLSIGGISGYTLAMRRYKANEILNIANKYALAVYAEAQTKMMQDPEHYFIEEGFGSWKVYTQGRILALNVVAFTNAGLGALPNELNNIELSGIITKSSGDLVILDLEFKDKTMCETTLTVAGLSDDFANSCARTSPFAEITFIMN